MAGRGARAAGDTSSDWISERKVTRRYDEVPGCVPQRLARDRLCRRPQCDDRLPRGGRSVRSPSWARRRPDSSPSGCHRCARHGPITRSQGSDCHNPNCFFNWRGPGAIWLGRKPEPAGRQSNGLGHPPATRSFRNSWKYSTSSFRQRHGSPFWSTRRIRLLKPIQKMCGPLPASCDSRYWSSMRV